MEMDFTRLSAFINSFDTDADPVLSRIETEAIRNEVPIIRHEMIRFLQVLLQLKKPEHILEVGCATGFSAMVMASFTEPSCRITTIEQDQERIREAKKHFHENGLEDRITLLEGDAMQLLGQLAEDQKGCYDFVFLDAAKAQYIHFLPLLKELMAPEAVLVSDNVLQEGDLCESRYLVRRRDRTIYKRMREYLYALTHDEELITSIIPIGDGVTVSIKRIEKNKPE